MSAEVIDSVSTFLQSGIGVTLQIIGIIGAIIPAIKYFNSRFDKRVSNEIIKQVNPMIQKTCIELKDLANKLENLQISNETAIKYINEKIGILQTMIKRNGFK